MRNLEIARQLAWVIGGVQCIGLRVVGDYRKAGWVIACCADLVSIIFGATTGLLGFVVWPLLNCGIRIRHLYRYRHETWGRFRLTDENMRGRAPYVGQHRISSQARFTRRKRLTPVL